MHCFIGVITERTEPNDESVKCDLISRWSSDNRLQHKTARSGDHFGSPNQPLSCTCFPRSFRLPNLFGLCPPLLPHSTNDHALTVVTNANTYSRSSFSATSVAFGAAYPLIRAKLIVKCLRSYGLLCPTLHEIHAFTVTVLLWCLTNFLPVHILSDGQRHLPSSFFFFLICTLHNTYSLFLSRSLFRPRLAPLRILRPIVPPFCCFTLPKSMVRCNVSLPTTTVHFSL